MRAGPAPAWVCAGVLVLSAPAALAAQDLLGEVESVGHGTVVMQYPVDDGVEVCDGGVRIGERFSGRWRNGGPERCVRGVGELTFRVRAGEIRGIELQPPGVAGADLELGRRTPEEVADLLMTVAEVYGGDVARYALLPATVARDVEVWPRLAAVARDRGRPSKVREQAVFWLGQAAAQAAVRPLGEIARDDDEDHEIREAAVFALSQRPDHEGVPLLMELARTSRHADVRRNALFWLAQSAGEDVIDFFEDILRGG